MSAHTGKGASAVEWSAIPGIVIVTSVGQGHRQPRARAATILAKDRVSLDSVSKLLGHSSIKITERHYAPWVKARQDQLESEVRRIWT